MALEILLPSTEETKVVLHLDNQEVTFDLGDLIVMSDEAFESGSETKEHVGVVLAGLFNSKYEQKINATQATVLLAAVSDMMYNFKKKSLILPPSIEETTSSSATPE